MSPNWALITGWVVVTLALAVLLIVRARLESQESDWIDLTEDDKEDRAIQTQTVIEKKAQKLVWPIRVLGAISILLLLAILGIWVYSGIMTPPPAP
jgi:hypothetical protein